MAGFTGGRRAPNVSQYIANLNTIHSPQDMQQDDEGFRLEDDLAVFTNAEFYNFDLEGDPGIEQVPGTYDPAHEERARRANASGAKNTHKMEYMNGMRSPSMITLIVLFRHLEFYLSIIIHNKCWPLFSENFPIPNFPPYLSNSPSTTLEPSYPSVSTYAGTTSPTVFAFPTPPTHSSVNQKNGPPLSTPTTNPSSPTSPTTSHFAAEEDKRRRNTAASARFRVKKKQREQALERTAKELGDKAKELEKRVTQLETENEWLRGLVVDRNGVVGLEKAMKDREEMVEKVEGEKDRKKGVGTIGSGWEKKQLQPETGLTFASAG